MKSVIVNLFGAPSAGKSKMAHGLTYRLKQAKIRCEFTGEAAKDFVWDERDMANQKYIFAKQENRIHRLAGKVDVIISDSPLLLPFIYAPENYPVAYFNFVQWCYDQHRNINFLINPEGGYDGVGRVHSEEESQEIQKRILDLLCKQKDPYCVIPDTDWGLDLICAVVNEELKAANE